MITAPERSAARDAALAALLPTITAQGWTRSALRAALGETAPRHFPGGVEDAVEAYLDWMDRRMVDAAAEALRDKSLTKRVRGLIGARLHVAAAHKQVVRRTLAFLAMPRHAPLSARCFARTLDTIWHAAGDRSADFSWYTKRATLAAVYGTTLLFWLHGDTTEESALEFLDRRLAGAARIGKLRARLAG